MNGKLKIEQLVKDAVRQSVLSAMESGKITIEHSELPEVNVEVPKDEKFGDLSVNIAMQLAKRARMNPRNLAQIIIDGIATDNTYIDRIEIAGAGFINFYFACGWLHDELADILEKKQDYGRLTLPEPKSVNFEYVSANPTGPLHIGNARGGAVGDAIANIFEYAGYSVTKEFYVNDAGNQIVKFGQSIGARYMQLFDESYPFPEDGYQGEYIAEYARDYYKLHGDSLRDLSVTERGEALSRYALDIAVPKMKQDLADYGVDYDVWFFESSLHSSGAIGRAVEAMRERGAIFEQDGALWFRASEYGCEKDEVLIRQNGIPTYYAADIAYHYDKLAKRHFDRAIDVWGADHHGHVLRMKQAMKAILGTDEDRLDVILMQLVQLKMGEETIRLSKRKGNIVTLSDLVEEIGVDCARYMFNTTAPSTHMEFDLDLAVKQSNENPVFYVQYAHARMCAILRNIDVDFADADLTLLKEKQELALLRQLAAFSAEIVAAAEELDPSRMTRYAANLASLFHSFYNACRVKCDDLELCKARLALVCGSRYVLGNVLRIIGVNAPEQM